MNARQIEAFHTIMRCRTLTAAAQALNISQPALSQLLLHAEDKLGYKLFRRMAGGLVPTPEALQLLPEAERLHRDLENFRRFAGELREGRGGSVRLAVSGPPALSFVPLALQNFRAAFPAMQLVSFVVPAEVIMTKLEAGEADLGIAMTDRRQPLVEGEPIGESQIVCLLRAGHRLEALPAVTAADLEGETLISYHADSLPGARLDRALAQEGSSFRPQVEIDSSIIALSFVQQGIGVALVDGLLPWASFPGLVVRPFRPTVPLPISLLASSRRPLSRNQDRLRAEIRRAIALYAADPLRKGLVRAAS